MLKVRLSFKYNARLISKYSSQSLNSVANTSVGVLKNNQDYRSLEQNRNNRIEKFKKIIELRNARQSSIVEKVVPVFGELARKVQSSKPKIHSSLDLKPIAANFSLEDDALDEESFDGEQALNNYRRLNKPGERPNTAHLPRLLKKYCKAGDTEKALSVFFDRMLTRDRVMPTRHDAHTLIDALMRVADSENAFKVYRKMTELGISATQATYSRLFRACAEDVAAWMHDHEHLLPPAGPSSYQNAFQKRRTSTLRTALSSEELLENFGGPALNHVYNLWKRLKEKRIQLTGVTYNTLILALAKGADIQSCLQVIDEMQATIRPDSFTLTAVLSAIPPAICKRRIVASLQPTIPKSFPSQPTIDLQHMNAFQLALHMWHYLLPQMNYTPHAKNFTLLLQAAAQQDDRPSSSDSVVYFDPLPILKLNPHRLSDSIAESNGSSDELGTSVALAHMKSQRILIEATQMSNHQRIPRKADATHQELPDMPKLTHTDCVFIPVDWSDTQLALKSPVNILIPLRRTIALTTPRKGWLPWQRLALMGGLHGFIEVFEKQYKCTVALPLVTRLVQLLPHPGTPTDENSDSLDIFERELFHLCNERGLSLDMAIYNALIDRRTSNGHQATYLLSDAMNKGLQPDPVTWGTLARGCKTLSSVKTLLRSWALASRSTVSAMLPDSGKNNRDNDELLIPCAQPPADLICASKAMFASLLAASQFNWDVKAYLLRVMSTGSISDKANDRGQRSDIIHEIAPNRRMIANLEIEIAYFRELINKGVIPHDGSAVSKCEATGGISIPPFALTSFRRFLSVYRIWIKGQCSSED